MTRHAIPTALYADTSAESRLPLQDRVALRLGRMTMRFAAAEAITRSFLLQILNVNDDDEVRIQAILGELSFRKLRAAFVGAVRADEIRGTSENLKSLREIVGRLDKLEQRRNVLTHSVWNYRNLPNEMIREKHHVGSTGVIRNDTEIFKDLNALDEIVHDIDTATNALVTWYVNR